MIWIGIYVSVLVECEKVTEIGSETGIWNVTEILVESFPFPSWNFFLETVLWALVQAQVWELSRCHWWRWPPVPRTLSSSLMVLGALEISPSFLGQVKGSGSWFCDGEIESDCAFSLS